MNIQQLREKLMDGDYETQLNGMQDAIDEILGEMSSEDQVTAAVLEKMDRGVRRRMAEQPSSYRTGRDIDMQIAYLHRLATYCSSGT